MRVTIPGTRVCGFLDLYTKAIFTLDVPACPIGAHQFEALAQTYGDHAFNVVGPIQVAHDRHVEQITYQG